MNVAAVASSFGIVVAIFQWGWGSELLGLGSAGPIEPFLPVIMVSVLFGLSMDYQVFLVSRMYEEWQLTRNNCRAVRVGLAETSRVINSAAVIMIAVFGAFVLSGDRIIAMFGIGLAAAVALDAFVLRTLLVPALMHLLGGANWWLPSWLDRWLPRISIEPPPEPGTAAWLPGPQDGEKPLVGVVETQGPARPGSGAGLRRVARSRPPAAAVLIRLSDAAPTVAPMGTTRTTENRTDDETTVPAQAAKETAAIPETTEAEAAGKAAAKADEEADDNAALAAQDEASDLEADDGTDRPDRDTYATAQPATGIAAGAGAVVAAGLGLASVTGTWLGTTMAERANLMGQIKVQSGKAQAADQISAVYGASWHTNALVNGFFALLAVIAAAVVLTRSRATWVRAVAWGGLALGVLGILISAGMYLDLFGSMPTVPKAPAEPAAPRLRKATRTAF